MPLSLREHATVTPHRTTVHHENHHRQPPSLFAKSPPNGHRHHQQQSPRRPPNNRLHSRPITHHLRKQLPPHFTKPPSIAADTPTITIRPPFVRILKHPHHHHQTPFRESPYSIDLRTTTIILPSFYHFATYNHHTHPQIATDGEERRKKNDLKGKRKRGREMVVAMREEEEGRFERGMSGCGAMEKKMGYF